ncbi:CoA transferase [Spongiactinospora sp. TRM90649]|uniref:CaiB/BaiF CoA transferase family protein n=1 Tax=Spongiactinospora sp. TRM90649 TaxID=3031114 RepID=UPI0023F80D52|nr:CoA transferase [Spongiactinospora sp. TRM90649]MDF5757725.1 CoA transferase [Spongiactinospora sp. TRM90649]
MADQFQGNEDVVREQAAALDGIRVLDLGRVLSGPFCGRVLADLGAEVIKIEPPAGDDGRHFGPFYDGVSSYHRLLNRNKYGITLDLKTDEDRRTFTELIRRSDVLIENFRPGVIDRLGFSPERLLELNPRLVAVSISGYGRTGPLSGEPAYDLIVQAMSGLMSVTGPDGGPAARVGVSVGDMVPGMWAAIAVLAALRQRDATGRGQHIDVAMFDGLLSILESVAMRALLTDEPITPTGSHHAISAPFGTFATRDRPIAIAVANDPLFTALAAALGHPEWPGDARFRSDAERGRHRHELRKEVEGALSGLTHEEAIATLSAAGVPCGPVLDVRDTLNHPQVAARGMVRTEADGFPTLAAGFRMAGSREDGTTAPALGQHNDLVAAWIGEPARTRQGNDDV